MTAIKNNTLFTEKVLPYNSTGEGAAVFNNYHLITEFSFPEYLDEIRGMAQGAQLSYSEVGQLSKLSTFENIVLIAHGSLIITHICTCTINWLILCIPITCQRKKELPSTIYNVHVFIYPAAIPVEHAV